MQRSRAPTLEQKVRYLKEVDNIYRLSKTTLPPQGTTWASVADRHLKKALGMQVRDAPQAFNVRKGMLHHQHDPRTARVVERTLRNGTFHPDVLHAYRGDGTTIDRATGSSIYRKARRVPPLYDTPDVHHFVQHTSADLPYPDGHLQGHGFVPRQHSFASHVQLEQAGPVASSGPVSVPTKAAGGYA